MKKKLFSFESSRPKKLISSLLIFTLFFTQTVQVNWFEKVEAGVGSYRDIVSIVVDADTYSSLEGDIKNYATNVQTYLGQTRTAIVVVDAGTPSSVIATKNESLYYEWESEYAGPSQLVGTILIGNVPVPMVEKGENFLPSLYPYVDFKEKAFVYNPTTKLYEYSGESDFESPEIWHGVINPAVGRNWSGASDIEKIKSFLKKTDDFYKKQGKFTDSSEPPRVYFYDGFTESRSVDARSLFQYQLLIKNLENLAYNRYSKYLLRDINDALKAFDASSEEDYSDLVDALITENVNDSEDNAEFQAALAQITQNGNTLTNESFKDVPDIQTINHVNEFLNSFNEIFNENVLGNELKAVHNAGRYNSGSTVRADIGAFNVTLMDKVARDTLKTANNAFEKAIEENLKSKQIIRPVLLLQSYSYQEGSKAEKANLPFSTPDPIGLPEEDAWVGASAGSLSQEWVKSEEITYDNYFFGENVANIQSATGCTIARGGYSQESTEFGREILTEANTAFNVHDTESQIEILRQDWKDLSHRYRESVCFEWPDEARMYIESYWGGNTVLRIANQQWNGNSNSNSNETNPVNTFPAVTKFTGFTRPIYTLQGMKETDRLPVASLNACISDTYGYILRRPSIVNTECSKEVWSGDNKHDVQEQYKTAYPEEWNSSRSPCGSVFGQTESPGRAQTQNARYTCISVPTSAPSPHDFTEEIGYFREKDESATSVKCLNGGIIIDGKTAVLSERECIEQKTQGNGQGESADVTYLNKTIYRNLAYKTVNGYLKHESPTKQELEAATESGVTPNLAIDTTRSIEFLTPKGNIATIEYPNFFRMQASTVDEVRQFLKTESETQWQKILDQESATALSDTQREINTSIFNIASLSGNASDFDWNQYISDEEIVKILQAKNWIHPDVTKKYKQALETSLSYSHEYSQNSLDNPPKISNKTDQDYEIAYLGLAEFSPESGDGVLGFSQNQETYSLARQQIQAINMTDQESDDTDSNSSTECGPPDGVIIWKWPAAIQCWIKTLFPIEKLSGKCSSKTIGEAESNKKETTLSSLSSAEQVAAIQSATLVSHLPREVMTHNDAITLSSSLETSDTILSLSDGATAKIELLSLVSDGKAIDLANSGAYLSLSPASQEIQSSKAQFILSSKQKSATATFQITYTIPVGDGQYETKKWEPFDIIIGSNYAVISLSQWGTPTYAIDADSSENTQLSVQVFENSNTATSTPLNTFSLTIYDDITDEILVENEAITNGAYTIPAKIARLSGSYRAEILGSQNQYGSITFSVLAWELANIAVESVSNAVIAGEDFPVRIRLLDTNGNTIEPSLHTVKIKATGGKIILNNDTKENEVTLDVMNGYIDASILADNNADTLTLEVSADDGAFIQTKEVPIYTNIKIQIIQQTTPKVGDEAVPMQLKLLDENGDALQWFDSIFSANFADGGGSFEREIIKIRDGVSDMVRYEPGTLAGKVAVTLSIPGYGIVETEIQVDSGEALYSDHTTIGNMIQFSLRDRYGNIAVENLAAKLTYNAENTKDITFSDGIYTTPRKAGYYTIEVPELETREIEVKEKTGVCGPLPANPTQEQIDAKNACKVAGIPKYSVYIKNTSQSSFDFLPDYNARYTVLAGGDFLREGEDILYNTDEWKSQSLAVTTLLGSPYVSDTLLSVLPSGQYRVGNSSDTALSSSLQIKNNFPIVSIKNEVDDTILARVLYSLSDAEILTDCDDVATCTKRTEDFIALKKNTNSAVEIESTDTRVDFTYQWEKIASLYKNGSITSNGIITLEPDTSSTANGLHFTLYYQGIALGEVLYHADENTSIVQGTAHQNGNIVLDTKRGNVLPFSQNTLVGSVQGYKITQNTNSDEQDIDTQKFGPSGITSIGEISETPNVWWQDDNTMMLSYAAGDTVGQATQRFHTFMMVNMWDPVAHVQNGRAGTQVDGIDRSVGTQIGLTRKGNVDSVLHRDMNNDGLEDIVVVYSDGYIELLLNFWDRFRSRDMISYIPSQSTAGVHLGDFSGDNYADIISVNSSGSIQLWENTNRKLSEKEISVTNGNAPTGITQLKVYDMDADGKDDIVFLTSGGKLAILYGSDTSGQFSETILDSALGISLSLDAITDDGALYSPYIDTVKSSLQRNFSDTEVDDSIIQSLIYYDYTLPTSSLDAVVSQDTSTQNTVVNSQNLSNTLGTLSSAISTSNSATLTTTTTTTVVDNTATAPTHTFMRSAYLSGVSLSAQKTYESIGNTLLVPDDSVQVTIQIQNNSSQTVSKAEYLDTVPAIFDASNTQTYSVSIWGRAAHNKEFKNLYSSDYDAFFEVGDIPAGQSAIISYQVKVLPASFGEMLVDDFERSTAGADRYADVAFKTDTTCGGNMLLYLSTSVRSYAKTTNNRDVFEPELSDTLQENLKDEDGNGIPDSVEGNGAGSIQTEVGKVDIEVLTENTRNTLKEQYADLAATPEDEDDSLIQFTENGTLEFTLDFDSDFSGKVEDMAQEIFDGLACGFGGGSCISFPLNWAPLAPGSDPVAFGTPIGDGLKVGEWLPIFSALTWRQTMCGNSPCCLPSMYPMSSLGQGGAICGSTSAGGYLGTWDATNVVRIFVTPTLTLGMGTAICFGGPASTIGGNPGQWLFPLVQAGNCIVIAKAMPFCEGDGSSWDGDVSSVMDSNNTWNASSCEIQADTSSSKDQVKQELKEEVISYIKGDEDFDFAGFSASLSEGNISSLNNSKPLLQISPSSGGGEEVIDISIDSNTEISDFGKIVNTKNNRIAGFPDFIMDWVARQMEEVTNALFTPPSLTIIPPIDFGQNAKVDSTYKNFLSDLGSAYSQESLENLSQQMGESYDNTKTPNINLGTSSSWLWQKYSNLLNSGKTQIENGTRVVSGGLNSIQAAYQFIGNLPFVKITQAKVAINIPWILPSELDQYEEKLDAYINEVQTAMDNWCANLDGDELTECLESKGSFNDSEFFSSIQANMARIQEYKQFPEKLKKYLNWKQKYLYQLTCNIEAIQEMTIGWIKDNGIRFQKWAELFVLLKAIAETWQPMLDIFNDTSAQCGVCRNERYNSQYWKFKLISVIVPKVPVIQFPRWPDIILDLSDIRLGISVVVPDFTFNISPIRLPNLPSLSLPDSPNASLTLPNIPVLPAIPELPDLPELPDIPTFDLPDLPPPPKLPKIFGAVKIAVKIMKLISKLYCFYQKTSLVPEWNAGDVIAQRTERQGTLPMDFLDIDYGTIRIPTLKAIKISSHVNFELKYDFLVEMARTAVEPINSFGNDIQNSIPSSIGEDVNIENPIEDIDVDLGDITDETTEEVQDAIDSSADAVQDSIDSADDGVQESIDDATKAAYEKQSQEIADSIHALQNEYVDTDEMYTYLTTQMSEAGLIDEKIALERDMQATRVKVANIQKQLIETNTQKFNLIRATLEQSQEDIAIGENIIRALRGESDTKEALALQEGVFLLASKEVESDPYAAVNTKLENLSTDQNTISLGSEEALQRSTQRIVERYENIVAQTAQVSTTTTNSSQAIATSYTPNFEGIYILTPIQKKQTRLFDYSDPVDKNTNVQVLDIDNDSDNDFLFLLDNKIFIKKNYLNTPNTIVDTATSVSTLSASDDQPFVVNYFDQSISSVSELSIEFAPAESDTTEYRLEFYDRYLDWYGEKDGTTLGKKMTVDLFIEDENDTDFDAFGIARERIDRSLASGFGADSFRLIGPNIVFLTGSIDLSLSSGRAIYTGKSDVQATINGESVSLIKHSKYTFENQVEIQASSGPLFIIGSAQGFKTYTASNDLEGLPILSNMQLISEEEIKITNHTTSQNISLQPDSLYLAKSLGKKSDAYSFTIEYPNGYYYAKLHGLGDTPPDKAGIVLLSPSLSNDDTPPVTSLDSVQRVPVYATKDIDLKEIITELSDYSVSIDADIYTDSDGDGISDNDFGNGDGASLSSDKILTLGKFEIPGEKEMLLRIVDENGNTSLVGFTVEVYTPIPYISNIDLTGATLSGSIDEAVFEEPIHFFRIRSSESPIYLDKNSTHTNNSGVFSYQWQKEKETITLTANTQNIEISVYGAIQNLPAGLTSKVLPATQETPMKIYIQDTENAIVYEQSIVLPESAKIVHTLDDATGTGLLITTKWTNQYTEADREDPSIAGGAYITDADDNPLLAIAGDGNIYILDENTTLTLASEGEYIKIIAIQNGQEITNFVYKVNFYYTK